MNFHLDRLICHQRTSTGQRSMIWGMEWRRDDEALALVEQSGEPFNNIEFRLAWMEAGLGWSDVSFGASGTDGTQVAIALLRRGMAAQSLPLGYGGIVASRLLDS